MTDFKNVLRWVGRSSKRVAVSILGAGLVAAGLAMLVLPGPGILVIIAGLAVLASEYAWARRALDETKRRAAKAADTAKRRFRRKK